MAACNTNIVIEAEEEKPAEETPAEESPDGETPEEEEKKQDEEKPEEGEEVGRVVGPRSGFRMVLD